MTWPDKLFLAGYFLMIIFIQAKWQHALFKANKPISHKLHAVIYVLTCLPMMYFFMVWWWKVPVIALSERLALFGPILNAVRGKKPILTYNGRRTTGSWQNQVENKLSDTWVAVLKVFYVALFVTVMIIL